MERTRRVGTFSLGVVLVVYGVLFLLHLFFPALPYTLIMHLWPCILIILGIEILVATTVRKNERFTYDFAAICIICILSLFAVMMAGLDYAITNQLIHIYN